MNKLTSNKSSKVSFHASLVPDNSTFQYPIIFFRNGSRNKDSLKTLILLPIFILLPEQVKYLYLYIIYTHVYVLYLYLSLSSSISWLPCFSTCSKGNSWSSLSLYLLIISISKQTLGICSILLKFMTLAWFLWNSWSGFYFFFFLDWLFSFNVVIAVLGGFGISRQWLTFMCFFY